MITITLSSDAMRILRTIREWCGRVVAMGCIIWGIAHGLPLQSPSTVTAHTFPSDMVWTSSSINRPRLTRIAKRVKKPTNPIICLAQNLYFEGKNEPEDALEAVAATVFNRMESSIMPNSVCGVIYQPFQYSWTLNTSNWSRTPPKAFVILATHFWDNRDILQEEYPVTHFHRVDIEPRWSHTLTYVGTFGQHKFYRM